MKLVIAALIAVTALGAGSAVASTSPPATDEIAAAVDRCGAIVPAGVLLDDGHSVVMDDVDIRSVQCIIDALGIPAWTTAAIMNANSMMGLLEFELDDFTVLASYHPDNGLFFAVYDDEGMTTTPRR